QVQRDRFGASDQMVQNQIEGHNVFVADYVRGQRIAMNCLHAKTTTSFQRLRVHVNHPYLSASELRQTACKKTAAAADVCQYSATANLCAGQRDEMARLIFDEVVVVERGHLLPGQGFLLRLGMFTHSFAREVSARAPIQRRATEAAHLMDVVEHGPVAV